MVKLPLQIYCRISLWFGKFCMIEISTVPGKLREIEVTSKLLFCHLDLRLHWKKGNDGRVGKPKMEDFSRLQICPLYLFGKKNRHRWCFYRWNLNIGKFQGLPDSGPNHTTLFLVNFTRWWFQTFLIYTPTWGDDPFWLIFFNWVETTNWSRAMVFSAGWPRNGRWKVSFHHQIWWGIMFFLGWWKNTGFFPNKNTFLCNMEDILFLLLGCVSLFVPRKFHDESMKISAFCGGCWESFAWRLPGWQGWGNQSPTGGTCTPPM